MGTAPGQTRNVFQQRSLGPQRLRTVIRSPVVAWILACTAAETLGIGTAAAVAVLLGEPQTAGDRWLTLAAMMAAGAVEGTALGILLGRQLHRRLHTLSVQAFLVPTVLFAVFGWGVGMGSASGGGSGDGPPFAWVMLGAALLGAAAGAVLGAAQWLVLRKHAQNAARWIGWSAAGWACAMVAIFAGATLPDATTPPWLIVLSGATGGAVGGALLGMVTAHFATTVEPVGPAVTTSRRV